MSGPLRGAALAAHEAKLARQAAPAPPPSAARPRDPMAHDAEYLGAFRTGRHDPYEQQRQREAAEESARNAERAAHTRAKGEAFWAGHPEHHPEFVSAVMRGATGAELAAIKSGIAARLGRDAGPHDEVRLGSAGSHAGTSASDFRPWE